MKVRMATLCYIDATRQRTLEKSLGNVDVLSLTLGYFYLFLLLLYCNLLSCKELPQVSQQLINSENLKGMEWVFALITVFVEVAGAKIIVEANL
jgi:hypothetical protein